MKKNILLAIMLIGLTFGAQAQDISKNALGLRLAINDDNASEVSYQRGLSDINRMELDLGWGSDAFKLSGIYQWVWNIDSNLNWYAGGGGGFGSWNNPDKTNGTFIFATGDVGIEYNFDIPLQLSLDIRPGLGVLGDYKYTNNHLSNIALGIRYRF